MYCPKEVRMVVIEPREPRVNGQFLDMSKAHDTHDKWNNRLAKIIKRT